MPSKKRQRTTARKRTAARRTASARRLKPPSVPRHSVSAALTLTTPEHSVQEKSTLRFFEVVPSLAVRDVIRSRSFYQKLGFAVAAQLPPVGPPEWLRLERDAAAILVWNEVIAAPEVLSAIAQGRGTGSKVRISVSDVDLLAGELQENGIVLRQRPETMPDQTREITVIDPDGYIIEFASISRLERGNAP